MSLAEFIGDYRSDWSVWFDKEILVAVYDGSYTIFNRKDGALIVHGDAAKEYCKSYAVNVNTPGEKYEAWY
jgi:hypothetical protein